ncbi:MAG: hypothetical protein ACLFN0_02990 [Thermovirgaceae bacterium]
MGRTWSPAREILLATVVLWAVAFFLTVPTEASVSAEGIPQWLRMPVERSLSAVWNEVSERPSGNRERIVELVAKRLFPGLEIQRVREAGEDLEVAFTLPSSKGEDWTVEVGMPDLPPFLEKTFLEDSSAIGPVAAEMLDSLPMDVLRWAGEDFQSRLGEKITERLPGWKPSFVYSQRDGAGVLEISFTPDEPVVVAFSPRLSSRSLPLVLQTKLQEETLDVTSGIVGLPAVWVERHKERIQTYVATSLEEKWAARELEGKVEVNIRADRIAPVDVEVESTRYILQAWLGVYIGSDERYPEVGVHAGRRMTPFSGWEIEGYGEFVIGLNDGDIDPRFGLRWRWTPDVWIGIERSFEDDEYWGRIWFDEILPKLYAWGRFREDGETEAGIGWRTGEHLSWELYYDSRDDQDVGLRIMGNL